MIQRNRRLQTSLKNSKALVLSQDKSFMHRAKTNSVSSVVKQQNAP